MDNIYSVALRNHQDFSERSSIDMAVLRAVDHGFRARNELLNDAGNADLICGNWASDRAPLTKPRGNPFWNRSAAGGVTAAVGPKESRNMWSRSLAVAWNSGVLPSTMAWLAFDHSRQTS